MSLLIKILIAIFFLASCGYCGVVKEEPARLEVPVYRNGKLVEKHYIYPDNSENNSRIMTKGAVLIWVEYDKKGSTAYYGRPERFEK